MSCLQNVSSEAKDTASETADGQLVGGTGEVGGCWLDGGAGTWGSSRRWGGCEGGSDLAWCAGCEDGGCRHGGAGGEGAVGDCHGLLGSSSVGGS